MAADPGAGFPDLASGSRVSEESIPQRRGRKNASELSRRYRPATACGILLGGRMRKDVALRTGEARLSPLYRPAVRDPTPYCFNYLNLSQTIRLLHRIESLQFDACICCAELPVHRADSLVPMILPTLNLLAEILDRGNVVGQALPR